MSSWNDLTALCRTVCPPGGWKPEAIRAAIDEALTGSTIAKRETLGKSFEGRPIEILLVGSGPKRVMMWSQMHGDEPTHTTALINLLAMLANGEACAETLLSGLSMGIICPLNPDGAQHNTRVNGQGIDVNRDALKFATPEGRALREAIQSFKPDYGFNLHNQGHRTGVGMPPKVVAASLLVPPIDPEDTQTEWTREATRVAAFFAESIREHCSAVSRYEIDYMARAFGEWVQRQGVSTVLVEASGWHDGDLTKIEAPHFAAFVMTLEAIAKSGLGDDLALAGVDPQSYLALDRSNAYDLFDVLVTSAGVAQHALGELSKGDLGVDYPLRRSGTPKNCDGQVAAIGDLHEHGGVHLVEAPDCVVAPGRIALAFDPASHPQPGTIDWDTLTQRGVTTAIVPIELGSNDSKACIQELTGSEPKTNAALVGYWKDPSSKSPESFRDQLIAASVAGIAAVASAGLNDEELAFCEQAAMTVIDLSALKSGNDAAPSTIPEWLAETTAAADLLGWSDRGRVSIRLPADFVLLKQGGDLSVEESLRSVFVGGTVVRDASGPVQRYAGRWIV